MQILKTFECLDQNSPNSCQFSNNKLVFVQILHQFSLSWGITPVYFFSWNCIYFQQKEPTKVQIWWNSLEQLKFCFLMGSFCKNQIKFQAKVQKSYISWDWRVMQNLNKNWLVVSNMTWRIWWIFQSISGLSQKNIEELAFMALNSDAKIE